MTVEKIAKIDSVKKLMSDDVLGEIFDEVNDIEREKLLIALRDKAMELRCATKLDKLIEAYRRNERKLLSEQRKAARREPLPTDNMTQFDFFDDGHELQCGAWVADMNGVVGFDMIGSHIACYHPILITKTLTNAETGNEKVRLAFYKGFKWREITVDKGVIASSTKIVTLADKGVAVTTESAKLLVRFLSDLENLNTGIIERGISTSKFGWIEDNRFMPYDESIEFDAKERFRDLYESLEPSGSYEEWMKLMLEIRAGGRYEPQLYMAGAFASILLKPLNVLPFILNLYGETGKGKTVAIMVAASIWANPGENRYITDPNGTTVAIELRNDVLNNLPIMIDDLSKVREKYPGDFTDLIYHLCGGKGKDRSNVNLGLNRTTSWQNVCLTNIERPLTNEQMKGGAINRILDFEMDDGYIFPNGNKVVSIIGKNYGYAGREWVNIIQNMKVEDIKAMQEDFLRQINEKAAERGEEKEEKQSIPLSVLLTADKIATEEIFKDGKYLDLERCVATLKNKGDVNENERAYEFIMSEVAVNNGRFIPDDDGKYRGECWGKFSDGYVIIVSNIFNRIAERGNFSRELFLQWAKARDLVKTDSKGLTTKLCRFDFGPARCIYLKMTDEMTTLDGFMNVTPEDLESLPFN